MPADPFGPTEFQLVLLRRMADHNPHLVDDALHEMGASHTDLREAHRRWQARLHSRTFPGGESRYRTVLGHPETVSSRRLGDMTFRAATWPVPLWPELRFEVLSTPAGAKGAGAIWNEWLIRDPRAKPPELTGVADLTPWSCTVDDAARAFPPAKALPPDAPTRARMALTDPEAGTRVIAHFTWGLLQYVVREP